MCPGRGRAAPLLYIGYVFHITGVRSGPKDYTHIAIPVGITLSDEGPHSIVDKGRDGYAVEAFSLNRVVQQCYDVLALYAGGAETFGPFYEEPGCDALLLYGK
jgi:hypothetical protein